VIILEYGAGSEERSGLSNGIVASYLVEGVVWSQFGESQEEEDGICQCGSFKNGPASTEFVR
jgi:hypothetical protein